MFDFRQWFSEVLANRRDRRALQRCPGRKPALETLEDRLVPSTGVVTTLASDDANTPGTLRYFIEHTTVSTIDFKPGLTGTLTLTSAHGGELDITRNLTINGPGATLITIARSASDSDFRIFEIGSGHTVSISGLTITGGLVPSSDGGGILADSGSSLSLSNSVVTKNGSKFGGGIAAQNNLTINKSTISKNTAFGDTLTFGGGIIVGGRLTMTNSTVSNNIAATAASAESEDGAWGGGLAFLGRTGSTITNSTFADNQAIGGDGSPTGQSNGAPAGGGGIVTFSSGLTLIYSTIAFNSATGGHGTPNGSGEGGGVLSKFGSVRVLNTIIGDNTASTSGPDVSGHFTDFGHNLIGHTAGSTGFGHSGDILNKNPGLNSLANNGGPTETISLQSNSPAIDNAMTLSNVTTDQRGLPRKPTPDIGAFETQPTETVGRRWDR